MATEKRLIDANPIVKFIMDGLNNPDKMKALGHDAIEILAEIEYAPHRGCRGSGAWALGFG